MATDELPDLIAHLSAALARAPSVELAIDDPDRTHAAGARYAGERAGSAIHRPWRVWVELADRLDARLGTPRPDPADPTRLILRFDRLEPEPAPEPTPGSPTEKYGAHTPYARLSKHEDPSFAIDFRAALARVSLSPTARVLDLGCNSGDDLAAIRALHPTAHLIGVDHSATAIAAARARFAADPRAAFATDDLLHYEDPDRFDLVLANSVLQSAGLDAPELLRRIVQRLVTPRGAVIVVLPNCRYTDGELRFGARVVNLREVELGLLMKDVAFLRRYLSQHHRRVFVTGRHYLLVTAVAA